jgi:hypothetical protein
MRRSRAFWLTLLPLAAILLLAAACGDDDDAPANANGSPSASAATKAPDGDATASGGSATTDATEGTEYHGDASTPIDVPAAQGATQGLLKAVTSQNVNGDDSVVFRFNTAVPGYHIEYIEKPTSCGSGQPVTVSGTAFLAIRFNPAVAHDDQGKASVAPTLTGKGKHIPGAVQACDLEGVVTWIIGVTDGKVPFAAGSQGKVMAVGIQ